MAEFTVYLELRVSTSIVMEADSPEDAIEAAYASPDTPSSIGHGAFGQAPVDEAGEWEPLVVSNDRGEEVRVAS